MLYIRTGKPGHGKTLNTIREVDQKAHAEGRMVYYHNINGLKPEQLQAAWFAFDDPEKWYELPADAIIVVDEAQGWFGARDPRARPPEHITPSMQFSRSTVTENLGAVQHARRPLRSRPLVRLRHRRRMGRIKGLTRADMNRRPRTDQIEKLGRHLPRQPDTPMVRTSCCLH